VLIRIAVPLLALLAAMPLAPLAAQDADGATAEEALRAAKGAYGPPPPRQNCSKKSKEGGEDEIVVCAEQEQDDSEFRVKSSTELDPKSRRATNDGKPRAPDVAGEGIFQGKATVGGLCVMGGCPPPPAYIFDISELPEAPKGSDADLIAKGEKRGD